MGCSYFNHLVRFWKTTVQLGKIYRLSAQLGWQQEYLPSSDGNKNICPALMATRISAQLRTQQEYLPSSDGNENICPALMATRISAQLWWQWEYLPSSDGNKNIWPAQMAMRISAQLIWQQEYLPNSDGNKNLCLSLCFPLNSRKPLFSCSSSGSIWGASLYSNILFSC